jgi:hypothetical protein
MDRDDSSSSYLISRRVSRGGGDRAAKSTGELPRTGGFGEFGKKRGSENGKYKIRSLTHSLKSELTKQIRLWKKTQR